MVRDVQTVTTSEVVGPMRDLMVDLEIHGLPVLDDYDSVVGIVTSSDLIEDLPPELLATAVMSDEVVSVTPDATLVEAARTMLDSRIHHLVVVDQGEVIGMASSFDLTASKSIPRTISAWSMTTVTSSRSARTTVK